MLQLLVQNGADPTLEDKDAKTPLHHAAYDDAELTAILLNAGADPTAGAIKGQSPFNMAIFAQKTDTLGAFLDSGQYSINDQRASRGHASLPSLCTGI